MDLASVVAALASVGVRVSGSNPNNNIQGDSSRACPTGLAGPEPSGTHIDPGQHFQHIGIKQFPKIFQVFGHKNMGTHSVSVAYTVQPDPPPWTLPEQGISRGREPIHKGQALLG